MNKITVGCEEWCELPGLKLPAVKARVDSGAKTSALHAKNIQLREKDGKTYVSFDIHPLQNNRKVTKRCEAPLVGRREIRSSSGHSETRYVILTPLKLGEHTWDIQISLTNRDSMGYRMLLGREAMTGRIIVDPEGAFLHGKVSLKKAESSYRIPKQHKRSLNIALLASNPDLYSNRRIIDAAEVRGHNIRFLDVKHCFIDINAGQPSVHYKDIGMLEDVDAVIPRIKPAVTYYGCSVTRQFETQGIFALNGAVAITRSRDKLRCLQMLSEKGVPMPVSGFASSPQNTKDLIRMVGGAPLVIKLLEGTQGRGVVLAETQKAAESVINAFKSLQANILVQEFVKESQGKDLRCFVIDGKVVGTMERSAAEGEFRANLHLGGTAGVATISAKERKVAIQAAKIMGLKVAGVDLIRSASGPKVLEVNSSPGLQGIEEVTGKDIAGLMIECIEKHLD